jgi:hypothetical protein
LTILILLGLILQSSAALPTNAELRLRRQWVAKHFDAKVGALPFSFTYGGRAATELLPAWKLERATAKPQPGRRLRTVTCSDPMTGLLVRCHLTEFDDFPALEWVLHFENRGTQDTPILASILSLDAEFEAAAPENVVVHHSLGEKNSGQSFAPVEDLLAPGSKELVFAPIGGRSSDGCMPFFNLAWQGGVALAIGWSGQWEARFRRSPQGTLTAQAGQQLVHCKLHPGETIRTPSTLLVFWDGANPLRGNNLLRQVLMAHYLPRRDGKLVLSPVCASVNWTAPDGSYEPSYAFRSAMTAGNILAVGNTAGRFNLTDPDTEQAVQRTVAIYRKLRPYMMGDFYPLFPHSNSEEVWFGYQFDRPDLKAGAAVLFRREKSKDVKMPVPLQALDAKRRYEVSFEDTPERQTMPGATLSALPVEIPSAPGSTILYYRVSR